MDQASEPHSDGEVLHGGDKAGAFVTGGHGGCPVAAGWGSLCQQSYLIGHRRRLIVFLCWLGLASYTRRHEVQPVNSRGQRGIRRPAPLQIKSSVEGPWRAGQGSLGRRAPCDRCSWQQRLYREGGLQPAKSLRVTGQGIADGRLSAPFGRSVQEPLEGRRRRVARWRPPRHHLRTGPGERDIEQPELLVGLLS